MKSSAYPRTARRSFFLTLLVLGTVIAAQLSSAAELDFKNPIGIFTNVASRLLQSELKVNLNHIQIHPTNEYSPAVHRLLQVTANLYDATTTNNYPTIFRPVFTNDGTEIFIRGFEQVDSADDNFLTLPLDLADAAHRNSLLTNGCVNIYGFPWILGVKKGLPNFNEICLESVFDIARRVCAVRPTTDSMPNTFLQEFIMGIELNAGTEVWNSYQTNFTTPVEVVATYGLTAVLTNSDHVQVSDRWQITKVLLTNNWPGFDLHSPGLMMSFLVPFKTNLSLLPTSSYSQSQHQFLPSASGSFEPVSLTPLSWGLNLRGQLRMIIREMGTKRILDYVQLDGPNQYRDLSAEIRTSGTGFDGLWNTNLTHVSPSLPQGILNQIQISLGSIPTTAEYWSTEGAETISFMMRNAEIAAFRAFFYASHMNYNGVTAENPTNLVWQVPFTPRRRVLLRSAWQANDPLVHYQTSDLLDLAGMIGPDLITPPSGSFPVLSSIGKLDRRYQPWGGNPIFSAGGYPAPFPYSTLVRDPHIRSTDDFDFPQSEPLNLKNIGQIHRGTPWQTLYLKSADILSPFTTPNGFSDWKKWTGNQDNTSAIQTSPTNDWRIVSLLTPLLNTNNVRQLFSVNNPNPTDWRALLDGISVVTNSTPETQLLITSNSPQAAIVASAIQQARTTQAGGYFKDVGDILSTLELSDASPWLNMGNLYIPPSDAALEKLPSELLSLLRKDSIGSISQSNSTLTFRFTGYDGYPYTVQASTDLLNWTGVKTNTPVNGSFELRTESSGSEPRFYRSMLLP